VVGAKVSVLFILKAVPTRYGGCLAKLINFVSVAVQATVSNPVIFVFILNAGLGVKPAGLAAYSIPVVNIDIFMTIATPSQNLFCGPHF
jgi:hypothetical protein